MHLPENHPSSALSPLTLQICKPHFQHCDARSVAYDLEMKAYETEERARKAAANAKTPEQRSYHQEKRLKAQSIGESAHNVLFNNTPPRPISKPARPQRPARVVSRQRTTQCRARRQQHTSKAAASASGDGGDSDPARPPRPHLSPVLPPHCRLSAFRLEVAA